MTTITCAGCGAVVDDVPGPVHAYMTSAPGCWMLHGELVVRGMRFGASRGTVQLRTDAYAAQHATNDDTRNRQSVAVHLMSLCATFDLGLVPGRTTSLIGGWTHRPGGYPDLISPERHGDLTVVDALVAEDAATHVAAVERWARSVWDGWSTHHREIHELLSERDLHEDAGMSHRP
jgi:hypothetical protein